MAELRRNGLGSGALASRQQVGLLFVVFKQAYPGEGSKVLSALADEIFGVSDPHHLTKNQASALLDEIIKHDPESDGPYTFRAEAKPLIDGILRKVRLRLGQLELPLGV